MKILKYLALLAIATVPLLLIEKKKQLTSIASDADDDIFERDLRTD